jgi:hypothetical protein
LFHLTGCSHETTLLHLALMEAKERHLPFWVKYVSHLKKFYRLFTEIP